MNVGYVRHTFSEENHKLQTAHLVEYGCGKIHQEISEFETERRLVLNSIVSNLNPGDKFVIYKLGVLGQNVSDLLTLIDTCIKSEVAFVSIVDLIDTSLKDGKLIYHGLRCLFQFEHCLIKERTAIGLRIAKTKGKTVGKPKGLSNHAESIARKAEALFNQGFTVIQIALQLNISRQTTYNYLKHRALCSHLNTAI